MDDPFPKSFTAVSSPRYFNEFLDENDDTEFSILHRNMINAPDPTYDDDLNNSFASYSSPAPRVSDQNQDMASKSLDDPSRWTTSPESSTSSDSSNQHHRTDSTNSSGTENINSNYAPTAAHGIVIGTDAADHDSMNKLMEAQFDFDSAASSPEGLSIGQMTDSKTSNGMKMPFRPGSLRPMGGFNSDPVGINSSPGSAAARVAMLKKQNSGRARAEESPSALSPSSFVLNPTADHTNMKWERSNDSLSKMIDPSATHQPTSQQSAMNHAEAVSTFPAPLPYVPPEYKLYVDPLPLKSRVETQANVRLVLDPMPPNITRLHLQQYTISKSKLIAKPNAGKTPNMLELSAMVVCTSAMQVRAKYERAMVRARNTFEDGDKPDGRRSSAGDANKPEDDENKPLNGGPVNICMGCVERERKRAARKKTKNLEEEVMWNKDETKRIVVFNTHEIKEWSTPNNGKFPEINTKNMPPKPTESRPVFSGAAMQVDLPMRIACYCRHHEEKIGFQVIFTLRDYQGNVVSQVLSPSIMITDDHKNHPPPNQPTHPTVFGSHPNLGSTAFPSFPTNVTNGMIPPGRSSWSTTDLPGMQHQFGPMNGAFQTRPFAVPVDMSHTTSTTMTPRNLSRPASPTLASSQQPKRRKASASNRVSRSDLTMTRIPHQGDPSPTSPFANTSIRGPTTSANVTSSSAMMISPTPASHGRPLSAGNNQLYSNPPTPNATDGMYMQNYANVSNRNQSYENLQAFPAVLSTPTSNQHSRAATPSTDPMIGNFGGGINNTMQLNGLPNPTQQLLSNSLSGADASSAPQPMPSLQDLTPPEGSKSGGYKCTCLGHDLHQGIQVFFGDAPATTEAHWGGTAISCFVPPAQNAGTVRVTLRDMQGRPVHSPSSRHVLFKYIEDDCNQLVRTMLKMFSGSESSAFPETKDPMDLSRYLRAYKPHSSSSNEPEQSHHDYRRAAPSSDGTVPLDELEICLLRCLELIDLDDTPGTANWNHRRQGGQSMLHLSASIGLYRLSAGLLARGAHPDLRDNNGMSPMHLAALHSNVRIIRKLRATGADPTLRSLNGFTPADMATTVEASAASSPVEHYVQPNNATMTPIKSISRANSLLSRVPSAGDNGMSSSVRSLGKEEKLDHYQLASLTPMHRRALSRRSSFKVEEQELAPTANSQGEAANVSQLAAQSALAVWRDQLAVQIQQFQQTVHKTLPPLPNLPDYQSYPVVRRISSLVQHQPAVERLASRNAKDANYRWWELLTGPANSPPAYEELYPDKACHDLHDKKNALLEAAGDALVDQKCATMFDQQTTACASSSSDAAILETVNIGKSGLTGEEQARIRAAHTRKVKRLSSDRKLFFIWIPLFVLVLVAYIRDGAPQIAHGARQIYKFASRLLPRRQVQEVIA